MGKIIATVLGFVGVLFVFVLLALFFVKIGWSLFVVPVFHLPELTWPQALGFSLLARCFRITSSSSRES